VKVLEADEKGRVRLSMKAAAEDDAKAAQSPSAESTPAA
jgi:predicted RNA-binding protein with RPS1 domain